VKSFEGIYVLVIQVGEDIEAKVGALGRTAFTKGLYAYVGSAQINMEQRIKRHLRSKKRRFWHIDYLLDNPKAKIIKVFFKEGDKTEECKTASYLSEKGEVIASFGCSDCKCKSHLFHIKNFRFLLETMRVFSVET
jgi:Uri superfamily endonuclease